MQQEQPGTRHPTSTEAGYVPCPIDELFGSLCAVHEILGRLGVEYIISGGTLLGAVRHGDLLPNDTDWDIEIVDRDVQAILDARGEFAKHGLVLDFPITRAVASFRDGTPALHEVERRIIKVRDDRGRFHGDFFIQTLFSDGILRRFNVGEGAYFNAKMTFPYWFIENRRGIRIRDREFYAPAEPVMMVERIYGPLWRTPLKRHGPRVKGYNFAGAYLDAPIEPGLEHALAQGWIPRYPDRPRWPREIRYVDTNTSRRWIARHEHVQDIPPAGPADRDIDDANARLVAFQRLGLSRLTPEQSKWAVYRSQPPSKLLGVIARGVREALAGAWSKVVRAVKGT